MKHIKESLASTPEEKKFVITVFLESHIALGVFPEQEANEIYRDLIGCGIDIYGVCGCLCRSGTEEEWMLRTVERTCKPAKPDYPEIDTRIKEMKILEVPADCDLIGVEYGGVNAVPLNSQKESTSSEFESFDPDMIFSIKDHAGSFASGKFIVFNGYNGTVSPESVKQVRDRLWLYARHTNEWK